jgi:putative ABC transport system permease protein
MPRSLVLRLALVLIRTFAILVPASSRQDWRAEWEAEVRHRWGVLHERRHLDWRTQMDLIRRALGALPDAAWMRRQFTTDAELVHDLRHGLRMLAKSPAFTLSAVLILSLGIGGAVSIATLLDTLFFRPLPYEDADRVVTIWGRNAVQPALRDDVAPADFLDWRERATSFSAIAAAVPYSYDYMAGDEPVVLFGAQVTEQFWEALGIRPIMGRTFKPEEHASGARRTVIITHGLWQSRFGGDPGILNRAIDLDGAPHVVVGVLPREFAPQLLPRPGELSVWTPKVILEHEKRIRASAWWNVVAKLQPGVTPAAAQAELDSIATAIARENPETNRGRSAWLVQMRDYLMGDLRLPLLLMLAAVLLVLGIGCANVASLLLARGMQREREFAIRAALGASRFRMVRQFMTESLLLAGIAAAVGLGLAHWLLRAIVALAPAGVVRLQDAAIDARILVLSLVLLGLTALATGTIPAVQLALDSGRGLRERVPGGPRTHVRRTLVAAEIAFALVLLAGAGLLIRSFARLMAVDPGFSADNVVAVQVFAWDRNGTADRIRTFFTSTLERMRAIPGVEHAGAVSAMPFAMSNIDIRSGLEIVGQPLAPGRQRATYVTVATPGYFRALSIPLREGRLLEDRDTAEAPRVAVISDELRRREWPAESPVGRRIRVQWQGESLDVEIVGVVSQIRHERLDRAARPEVFVPLVQVPFASMTYVLRGAGEPRALIDAARRAIVSVDPLQTVYDSGSLEAMVQASVVRERFSVALMSAFASVALFLCAAGVYGIISFTTALRTREIGVRMALGADVRAIRRMVLGEGSAVILVGLGLGLAGAAAASRYVRSLLYETTPGDPLTMFAACALLGLVGLTACYVPARRATRIDPLIALRTD